MSTLCRKDRITILTSGIIRGNRGQTFFNQTETAKVLGCSRHELCHRFDKKGILASTNDGTKGFTALDIAEYLYTNRISPLETRVK